MGFYGKTVGVRESVRDRWQVESDQQIADSLGINVWNVARVRRAMGLKRTQEQINGLAFTTRLSGTAEYMRDYRARRSRYKKSGGYV